MMFYVDQEVRPQGNTSVQYHIVNENSAIVGTVRIDYKRGKGSWTYRDKKGRKIRNRDTRARMSVAVNHYMDHQPVD